MTLVAVPMVPWGLPRGLTGATSHLTLDANNEKAAWIGPVPKTGTIDRVGFRTATVTLGETVDVRVETVGTDGNPSGTLWAANTNGAQIILATDDNLWFEVALTAGAAVTQGQLIAIVVSFPAVAVGNLQIYRLAQSNSVLPYTALYTGAWARTGLPWSGWLRYSDGTYPFVVGLMPWTPATPFYNNSSSPDERGSKITVPFACKVAGLWFTSATTGTPGDFVAVLYDSASNVLESVSVDGNLSEGAAGDFPYLCLFDTEVTLAAGQIVRAVKKPTTATDVHIYQGTLQAADKASATPAGAGSILTSRTDAGAWTDTTTSIASAGLVLTAYDDGQNRSGGIRVLGSAVAHSVI